MYLHLTLVTAAMLCSLCGCRSENSTVGGAAGTEAGATGSTSTTGPRGEDICKSNTFDALLTLNHWEPSTIRINLQKKPATEPLGSPCAAMQETCCKPHLEMLLVKELVRPHYKHRCANATKDGVGASCWRTGRQTRKALYNIIADTFKLLVTRLNDIINETLGTTPPPGTFSDFLAYMSQFLYTTNICQLRNATKAALQRLFDDLYQLQGGNFWKNESDPFQACYGHQSTNYLQTYNINAFNGLEGILNDYRVFNRALLLAEQVLHTIAGHKYPEECLRALPDLQHCAYCGGYSFPKPCLNFCLNTMRGCFANIATLKGDFNRLTTLLSSYADNIIAAQWQPNTLVDAHLSTFIIAAQSMVKTNLTLMVSTACTYNLTSNGSTPIMNSNVTSPHRNTRAVDMNSVTSVTGTGMAAAVLSDAINSDIQCIRSVEGLLDTMPELLCSLGKNPLSSGANDYCWNGSNVGSYLMALVGVSRDEQVNNPVFPLNLSVPYQYESLSDSIRSTNSRLRLVLDCLVSDDEDCSTVTFYTCVETDDPGSGSGQGDGDGFEDIEDIDVERPISAVSNQTTDPPSQSSTGTTMGMNSNAPTTSRGSVATRLNNTTVIDMNITVDTSDTTTSTTTTIAYSTASEGSQVQNSGYTSKFPAGATLCLMLFYSLWIAN